MFIPKLPAQTSTRNLQRSTRGRLGHGCSLLALAVGGAATALPALAQTADDDAGEMRIEEIVITGSKRGPQLAQDVPGAVQAIGGDQIDAQLATEFADLAGFVSGLQFQDLGPGDKEYIIRGVNSSGTATVGVYYGEAVITARNKQDGGGRQADIELHDLNRIEVLKGPQGTLYGASSMSGTIRFMPNRPDAGAWDFNAEAELSQTDQGGTNYKMNGMVNVPLIEDKLAVRGVGWFTRDSGFIDNVRRDRENVNDNEVEGGRIALRVMPTPELDIELSAVIQNRDVGGSSRFSPRYQQAFRDNLDTFGFDAPALGDLTNQDFTVSDWQEDIRLFGASAEYDAGFGTFFGTVNYFDREVDFRFDSTPILLFFGAPAPAVTFQPQQRELLTSEVRFASDFDGPVNFVAGGFLSREDKNFEVQVLATDEQTGRPIAPWDPTKDFFLDGPTNSAIFGRVKDDELDQEALFSEVTIDVTDKLQVIGGVRYFQFDITSAGKETKPFFGFDTGTRAVDIQSDADTLQFKANASYRLTPDHMVYFTASEGFRVGGTNDAAINPTGVPVPAGFDPDSLWNYEIGWKTAFFDNRLIFNGAGYLIFWDDIQVEGLDPSGAFPIITNAGKARIDGVEFDITARPAPGLELVVGGSLQDARLTQDQPLSDPADPSFDPNAGRAGDALPNVPDFQGFASAQYTHPLASGVDGLVRLDITYRGDTRTQANADSPFNVGLDSYTLVNLKAGVTTESWSMELFAKNVFDKRAQIDAINSAQDPLAFITVRPATFGIHARYGF